LKVNRDRKNAKFSTQTRDKAIGFDGRHSGPLNSAYVGSPVCCSHNATAEVNVHDIATTNMQTGIQVNHWQHGSGVIVEFINLDLIHVRFESDARVRMLCARNLTDINKRPLIKLPTTVY
jgi:hypothetical protein